MSRYPRLKLEVHQGKIHKLVNPKEVWQIFRPDPRNCIEIKSNNFVRIKRGAYKGDLAVVNKIDTESKNVIVFVVPRLKLTKNMMGTDAKRTRSRRETFENDLDIHSSRVVPREQEQVKYQHKFDEKGRIIQTLFDVTQFPRSWVSRTSQRHLQSDENTEHINQTYK